MSRDLPDDSRSQSAEYIAELTAELAKLARRSQLDLLAYLLDIASLEARTAVERVPASPGDNEERRAAGATQV